MAGVIMFVDRRLAKNLSWRIFLIMLTSSHIWSLPASAQIAIAGDQIEKTKVSFTKQMSEANALMVDGKYADAVDLYQQVLNSEPDNVEALAGLGMAYARLMKNDAADEQFAKALQLDPNNAVSHCGKAVVFLNRLETAADATERKKLLRDAGRECNKALDADARVVEAHYLLGKVYREEGRFDLAEQAFTGATRLDPDYSNAFAALGAVQSQREEYAQAAESLKKAISLNANNSLAYFARGEMYAKQGQPDRAVKEYNMSIYKNPNHDFVHIALGKADESLGDHVAAIREFEEALKVKPNNPDAYLCLVDSYESRGDLDNAIAKLHAALKDLPNNTELRTKLAELNLRLGHYDQAINDFNAALIISDRYVPALQGLARAFFVKSLKETVGNYYHAASFDRCRGLIDNAARTNADNVLVKLAAVEMTVLAGQAANLNNFGLATTVQQQLAFAEVLFAQLRFNNARDYMTQAIAAANNAKDIFAVADLAWTIRDLASAEAAYKKAATFSYADYRAHLGLESVQKAREAAHDDLVQADDLVHNHGWAQAIKKYHDAIYGDAKNPDARLGLAQVLEKMHYPAPQEAARSYREAAWQYKAYLSLNPSIPSDAREKIIKKIDRLYVKANKLDR